MKEILRHAPELKTLQVCCYQSNQFKLTFQNGSTPLHAAAMSGLPSLVLQLLAAGYIMDYPLDSLKHVMHSGADPDLTNSEGLTPMDISFGAAKQTLANVTSHITDPEVLRWLIKLK